MPKPVKMLLPMLCALALAGCQSLPVAQQPLQQAEVPPLPAAVGPRYREPNLTQRLVKEFSPSDETETATPASATPASKPTSR